MCSSVITSCNVSKSFLTCCVPKVYDSKIKLQLTSFVKEKYIEIFSLPTEMDFSPSSVFFESIPITNKYDKNETYKKRIYAYIKEAENYNASDLLI